MGRAGNATAWLCIGTWLLAGGAATAADWPQWRGPLRNGISTEPLPLDQWAPQAGPPVLWRAAVGRGHSAISVADGRAFTLGWDGSQDTVWCFDASDGTLIWKRSYDSGDIKQWPGPRATPTISGGRVFTLGLHGDLACWDARDGRPIWNVRLAESYNPDVDYGMAWSPLPCGEVLLLAAGAGIGDPGGRRQLCLGKRRPARRLRLARAVRPGRTAGSRPGADESGPRQRQPGGGESTDR